MKRQPNTARLIALSALFTSLITSATIILRIPVQPYGYINLGDVGVILSVFVLPLRFALFAASVGSAFADLIVGSPEYMIFTLFIKAAEVMVLYGLLRILTKKYQWIAFATATACMATLYAAVDGLLLQSFGAFGASLGFNAIQAMLATGVIVILIPRFEWLVDRLRSLDT